MNNDKPKRCTLLMRVSTTEQELANQRPVLADMARTRGYEIVEIIEEKISGVAKDREGIKRLMLGAHNGAFDAVLVYDLSRLGRSMVENIKLVLELDSLGVEVISAREPWLSMGGPMRNLLIAIFSWCAEQELAAIKARTRAGLERARREGKQIGRKPVPVDLARALVLRSQGCSVRQAAKAMRLAPSTLQRAYRAWDSMPKAAVPIPSPVAPSQIPVQILESVVLGQDVVTVPQTNVLARASDLTACREAAQPGPGPAAAPNLG